MQYDNVLGFNIGNEVITEISNTNAARELPCILREGGRMSNCQPSSKQLREIQKPTFAASTRRRSSDTRQLMAM